MGMFRELRADEIECRVNTVKKNTEGKVTGISLLLYKDARCDMRILDETVGPYNWQKTYSRDNANCTVSIWDPEKGQWISKEDTGTEGKVEVEKSRASDSFKRSCFAWGIGRELYTAPFIWIQGGDQYGNYKVTEISYENGVITSLTIKDSKGVTAYSYSKGLGRTAKKEAPAPSTDEKTNALRAILKQEGITEDFVAISCKKTRLEDITEPQRVWILSNIERLKEGYKAWSAKQA